MAGKRWVYSSQTTIKLIHECHGITASYWLVGNTSYHLLERTESLFKLTLSTTASDGEPKLEAPVSFVPCSLKRGEDGNISLTLKFMHLLPGVVGIVDKERGGRSDSSRLMGILNIQREMESFTKEDNTSRVAIYTVDADGSITSGVTEKSYVLIGVS